MLRNASQFCRDAGHAAARVAAFVRRMVDELGGDQVGTIGRLELTPNVVNVIPGHALLTVDLRNTSEELLQAALDAEAVVAAGTRTTWPLRSSAAPCSW